MVDDEEDLADAARAFAHPPAPASSVFKEVQQQHSRIWDASGVIPSQAVPVVGVPNYPNCVKWSEDNLLAVGAGHLVTILDPASMGGPRGFIPIATSPIFDFGRVQNEDLKAHSLFEVCLARDPRPGVRSIDWSPPGLAQNGGSLLAVCTTDNRVKVYRIPYCDFQSEWVEIIDLSSMLFEFCLNNDFQDAGEVAAQLTSEEETIPAPIKWGFRMKRKFDDDAEPQHRKVQKARHHTTGKFVGGDIGTLPAPDLLVNPNQDQQRQSRLISDEAYRISVEKGSRVEVLEEDEDVRYWVRGLVVEIVNGEAVVKLDQPQYGAMEQWVPLQGTSQTENKEIEEPSHGYSDGERHGKQVLQIWRPRIRPQLDLGTLERLTDEAGGQSMLVHGEPVEVWINDRWQEGTVLEVLGFRVLVNFSASSMNALVEFNNIRLAPSWHGQRWTWKTTSAISTQKTSVPDPTNNDACVLTTVEPIVHDLRNESNKIQSVEQLEGQSQSLGGANDPGQMPTTLVLYREQDILSCPPQPSPGQESPITQETKEKSYSRVYKRRGLPTTRPPTASLGTTRPTRTKRLPSKFRTDEAVSWIKDIDEPLISQHDLAHETDLNDKDVDYAQNVKGVKDGIKIKHARPTKDTLKVKAVESPTANRTLNEAKRDRAGEKERHAIGDNRPKQQGISPHSYAARSELLAPLSIAWSSQYGDEVVRDGIGGQKPRRFALLGAGMKSGKVSLWRIAYPAFYSIDNSHLPVTASFLGFLFAHESWVTNLSWASCCNFDLGRLNARNFPDVDGSLGDTLLLATGCSDGSVKLWAGLSTKLTGSNSNHVPFMLLKEVVEADSAPVTALALFVPLQSGDRALLAVGKGSGCVGVWELKSSGTFRQIQSQLRAHQQMVTGLSWTLDGRCLYSCGQDTLKRWDVSRQQLPFPDGSSVFPPSTASDICSAETLESYFGVALSPNGLALAAVRGIASDLLDQMYQARSQKGMVQLFWLGNEHIDAKDLNLSSLANSARSSEAMSEYDLACWELNVVDSLEALEDPRKRLVLWDVVAALSSLKDRVGRELVVSILSKWLSRWAPGQGAVVAVDAPECATASFQKSIPAASCRKLQLLTVLYRRLFLSHVKTDMVRARSSDVSSKEERSEVELWRDGLDLLEDELRQRLVHLNLQYFIHESNSFGVTAQGRNGLGMRLLVEWAHSNAQSIDPRVGQLAAMLQTTERNKRVNLGAASPMEACIFCDSSVSLESPEIATCCGPEKHRLGRCSVSMQVCPPVCLWHCGCCGRFATKLPSFLFFYLSSRDQIADLYLPEFNHAISFPFCPFCGILMHRLLPNFFLTPSLV